MKGNIAAIVLVVLGVFFLLTNLGLISISLRELLRVWWPVALIAQSTTLEQRVLVGTLYDIAGKQSHVQLPSPTLVIVGRVVDVMRQRLALDERASVAGICG